MSSTELKKYLYYVLRAEVAKFQLEQYIEALRKKSREIGTSSIVEKPVKEKIEFSVKEIWIGGMLCIVVFFISSIIYKYVTTEWRVFQSICIGMYGMVFYFIFLYLVDFNRASKLNAEKNRSYLDMIYYEAQNQQEEKKKIEMFINRLIEEKTEIESILIQLYNINIIYPKYRDIVAVSSFYQYIDSGRCDTLVGYNGAYNIYENELMNKEILSRLDKIIDKLDEIRTIQYVLYEMIEDTNYIMKEILKCNYEHNCQLDEISKDVKVIQFFDEVSYLKWHKKDALNEIKNALQESVSN